MIQRSPASSTRRPSTRLGVARTHVWRTLHEDRLCQFQPQRVQNLHPGYSAMLLEYYHWLHTNRQLLPLVLFTVEATVTRNGINSTRNSHRWFHYNPRGTAEKKFQHRFSINVWCGMIDDTLIGPVIVADLLTGKNYLDVLQNGLPEQLEDVPLATRIVMCFQHDGAPSHYTRLVMQHLNDILYVHVTVHRDNQQDASNIQNFILSRNSTCLGHLLCPSSGVISCIRGNWYVSCRLCGRCGVQT